MLLEIIPLLSDGQFHSGEELGQKLNLTRSAVWKIIQQLQNDWGIEIESRKGLGYRIPSGLQLLNLNEIQSHIAPNIAHVMGPIELFPILTSTNDYLMNWVSSNNPISKKKKALKRNPWASDDIHHNDASPVIPLQNRVCIAECQTKGKGRRGREWISPFGQNIYLSMLWNFPKDFSELSGLSLVIAIAAIKTIEKFCVDQNNIKLKPLGIKWPNDIIFNDRKLGGILIELSGETCNISHAVIGIGLNAVMPEQEGKKISQPWSHLHTLLGQRPNRNHILGLLITEMITAITLFQDEGLKPFILDWKKYDLCYDSPISLHTPQGIVQGKSLGINEKGNLLVETHNEGVRAFSTGEIVSLRKEPINLVKI